MSDETRKDKMPRPLSDDQLSGVAGGLISFGPLEKLMAERGVTYYQLIKDGVLKPEDVNKMKYTNSNYTMAFIDKLCVYFNCQPWDIVEFIPDL